MQAFLFLTALAAASAVDCRKRTIPDFLCLLTAAAGLISFSPAQFFGVLAALPLLIAALIRPECMGGGDIKLTAAAGFVLGFWRGIWGMALGLLLAVLYFCTAMLFQKFIHVREQMVERYGTAEQMEEYRRQAELRGTPEHKAKNWMGSMLFHLSHANDVDHAWASSRTKEELDQVVEPFVQAKRQAGQWTQEDEAGYQLYRQETDPEKRTFRVWYLIANPRGLPKEFVQKELEFRWKLFPEKKEETK